MAAKAFGNNIHSANNLTAGFYVVRGEYPTSTGCPQVSFSDTFEIKEPEVNIQFTPTQACPGLCNVSVNIELLNPTPAISYLISLDNNIQSVGVPFGNQCGGSHQYEIIADGVGCGVNNFGISQFAQMNLSTTVNNVTCLNPGSATVNITGVGASGLNTYCASSPQYNNFSTIDNIQLIGDNISINNNTSGQCDMYQDYTSISADVTPGNTYTIELELATSENLNLGSNFEYTLENNILKLHTKNVNTDMIKIISEVEKKTDIKNINIIKSSLEDAFLKLTN